MIPVLFLIGAPIETGINRNQQNGGRNMSCYIRRSLESEIVSAGLMNTCRLIVNQSQIHTVSCKSTIRTVPWLTAHSINL